MMEQEVRKQIGALSPVRRRKHMTRKVLIAVLAAVMLLGTTVAAGVVYRMHTEKVGEYAVKTKIESVATHTNDSISEDLMTQDHRIQDNAIQDIMIQDITMEVSYLPEGMVETEEGKYSYSENLNKGGVSIVFYKMDKGAAQFEMLTTDVK
ncbi:MAG: hypothetical protein K2O40_15165, partial [Lachnospiraceae bacterium]|nr:hypothetical protein [Lachnospiraceae bacterium]